MPGSEKLVIAPGTHLIGYITSTRKLNRNKEEL